MTRAFSAAAICVLLGAPAFAADGISGTWSSGAGPAAQTFIFRVQGGTFIGITCGPCDEPSTAFRIAEGRIVDAQHVTFVIDREHAGRDQVSATLSGTQLTLETTRDGDAGTRARMVLSRVLGKRATPAAVLPASPRAAEIDGRWVAVGRVAQQNITLKVRDNRISGVICGPCDDPDGIALIEDGVLDGSNISFYIHHIDTPYASVQANGSGRNFMKGTITGNVMKFKWVREGRESEPGGDMVFTGPIRSFSSAAAVAATDCDRECLRRFITQYLNAMVAHTPGVLPLAPNVRFTEDTVDMKLGEGLWTRASKIRPYRLDILDVAQGVAASQVVVEEAGSPVMLMLRLKIANKTIAEVETQVTRSREEGAIFEVDALQTPNAAMVKPVAPASRSSRAEAIRLAEFYPAGLETGSFVTVDAPFAADAYRFENGRLMAGKGCTFQPPSCEDIKGQTITKHPGLSYRVVAVDEELGITLLRMNFGPAGGRYGAGKGLMVWEAFKVYGGEIHGVEAFMKIMPVDKPSGWDTDVRHPGR
jgi:hypothetical protein